MATVIDSLVVLLGLDASNYKKGREQAEKETGETARKTKQSAEAITKSLTEVGRTVATLFLGFESASGFAKFLGSINEGEAQLGRTAKVIGMSAHELNKWGGAVALAGGNATDAQTSFRQLTEDFTKMTTTGERSPLLNFLMARGVNIRDQNGKLRDQGQIFEELANKTAQYGAVYQATMFRAAGLNEGEINYLVQSQGLREQQLAQAERNNMISEQSVADAQALQQHWRQVGQMITAAGQAILSSLTPTLDLILKQFGDINGSTEEFTTGLKLIGSGALVIKNIFAGFGSALGGAAAALNAALHGNFSEARNILAMQSADSKARNEAEAASLLDLWQSSPEKAAALIAKGASTNAGNFVPPRAGSVADTHNNPGNLMAHGQIRRFTSLAEGRAALDSDLQAKLSRGLDSVDKLISAYEGNDPRNNITAYAGYVASQIGKKDHLTRADLPAIEQAITDFESGNRNSLHVQAGPTPGLSGRGAGAAGAAGNSTTVTIGTIQVNAPQADPTAVAQAIPAAIQRKFSVTQADVGQN